MNTLVNSNLIEFQHVFIIEDNKDMAALLEIMLSKLGYSTAIYNNANDFLKAIPKELGSSIVITDMDMPQMTGVELQAELIRLKRILPIIFLSGQSTMPQTISALKQGAVDFLLKPVSIQQLKTAVESAFELSVENIKSAINKASLALQLSVLSTREKEVYELLILGYNNNEIRETLNISLPTAKQYKAAVMSKLKMNSLSDLIDLERSSDWLV
jgi:FixJ family two-component response regulator